MRRLTDPLVSPKRPRRSAGAPQPRTFETKRLLFEQGAWQTASAYIALSVASCVVGAGLGVGLIRALG